MAGFWERWTQPEDGEVLETFSILTTEANELVGRIHDRMPVLLRPEACARWLDPQVREVAGLSDLLRPLPPEILEMYQVSDLVNNVRFQGAACLARV